MKITIIIISLVFVIIAAIPSLGQNLVSNWDGIAIDGGAGTPDSYGWKVTSTELTWGPANGSGYCRYRDYDVSGGQTNYKWETTAAPYTSRVLMLRWDISSEINSGIFSYPVTLEANTKYILTFDCASGNGSSGGVPVENAFFSVGVSPNEADTIGMGNVQKQFFTTGVAKEFGSESFRFRSTTAGKYYLKFWKGSSPAQWEWFGIGKLSLEKVVIPINYGDTLRINFQPAPDSKPGGTYPGATVPEGFQLDKGEVFGSKGSFSYGWDESFESQARQRTDPALGNDPKGNMIQFNRPGKNGKWKIELPTGRYNVHLVGGDASYTDSNNSFLLNNVVLNDSTPALSNWDEYNTDVNVEDDGFLSFTSSDSANNAKICYIEMVKLKKIDLDHGDTLKINFQPNPGKMPGGSYVGATAPLGFLVDSGAVYSRKEEYAYGWNESFQSQARQRTDPALGDDPKGNMIQFNRPGKNGIWKVALAPGAYQVHLVGGDASYTDSKNSFKLNNLILEDQTPALSNWDEYNIAVAVDADSILSFTSSDPANNAKICYIEISKFKSSANIIKNGDFEDGLTGWDNMGGKVNIETDPGLVLSGSKSLKLGKTKSSMVYQRIIADPGEYVFSALGKEVSPDGAVSRVDIWEKTDNNKLFRLQFSDPIATLMNTKVSFAALDTFIIEAYTRSGGLDSAYFDNISLSKYNKPVVSITSPVLYQSVGMGDDITISAVASFAEKVRFFVDNKLIGELSKAPYKIGWTASQGGNYIVSAVAYDVFGDSVVSNVSLEVKTSNLIQNGGFEDDLNGWIDKGGKINILTDGASVIKGNKTLKLGPTAWSMLYQPVVVETGKTYLLSAWAREQSNNGAESRVQIWDKTDNTKYASLSFFNSSVAIQNFLKVEFPANDTVLIEVFTRDSGLDSVYFDDITLAEYNAPTVKVTTPVQDQIFGMDAIISIQAEATNATKVRFFANGEKIGETLSKPYTLDWDAPLDTFKITVAAFDLAGDSVVSEPISVIKQTEKIPPTPIGRFYTVPSATSILLKWAAATDASGIKGYIVYINDAVTDTVTEFMYNAVSLESNTSYTFKIVAIDLYDNVSQPTSLVAKTLMSTGLDNLNSIYEFEFYPNPVSDHLVLKYNKDVKLVSLINLKGQIILSKIPDRDAITLNVNHLENGLYILKADFNDGVSKYFRVVKK